MSTPCPRFGFVVRPASPKDADALRRELTERLAVSGLEIGGTTSEIVITREGSQATESDRQQVIAILDDELNTVQATVSDLVDLAY